MHAGVAEHVDVERPRGPHGHAGGHHAAAEAAVLRVEAKVGDEVDDLLDSAVAVRSNRAVRWYPYNVRHDLNETIVRLCVLDDPTRWAAYLAVRTAGRPLTRAEVADEAGISVRLAAFHLEKLLSEGFLEATYERDERPVVAGHPAKRYRPTGLELEVSIPPRRYDLAASILAEALEADSPDSPLESLADVAAEYGRQVGRRARARNDGSRLLTALRVIGFEPAPSGDDVVLRNCPFRHVAQARPEIICQMNLAFVAGVLAGTKSRSLHATLSPSTERCCVVVTP